MISALKNTKFSLTYAELHRTLDSAEFEDESIDTLDQYILLTVLTSDGTTFKICRNEEDLEIEIISVVFNSNYISHHVYPPLR